MGSSAWIRPFITSADQDLRDGVAGFTADTSGVAGGWDVELGGKSTAGISLSYAKTDVNGEDAGNTQTDITSYQVTLYGDYTISGGYIEGLVGFASNDVETSRSLVLGTLNRTASGAYDSDQFMAGIGAGMPIKVGSASFLTPHVGFNYTHVSSDTYTETGAGGLSLTVAPEDLTIALGIVGARYHVNMPTGDGTLTPEFRGSVMYDVASDNAQSSSTFTGGGPTFTTTGADVASTAYSVGAGLSYTTADGAMSIGADYDAEVKSDFIGHAGRIELKVHF